MAQFKTAEHPILGKRITPNIFDRIGYLAKLPMLAKHVRVWERQRTLDPERVQELVDYQRNYYKKYDKYNFHGTLTIALLRGQFVLLDGQHRFEALKILAKTSTIIADMPIWVEFNLTRSEEEIFKIFQTINKSISVPDTFINPNNLIKAVCERIKDKFPSSFTKASVNVITTKINQDQLESALIKSDIVKELKIDSEDQLYQMILDYNNKIQRIYTINDYKRVCPKSVTKEKIKEYLAKINNPIKKGLHLSMFKDFRWIEWMIEDSEANEANEAN